MGPCVCRDDGWKSASAHPDLSLRTALGRGYWLEADSARGNAVNTIRAWLLMLALVVFGVATANSAAAQIVALGDSNTQGRGVSPSEAWPAVLESMLRARGNNVHVANGE
jgi:hypothetical protein